MKRTIIIILLILAGIPVMAQYTPMVNITDIELKVIDSNLSVRFTLHADQKATNSDFHVVVQPVLLNQADSVELTPILIQGKRAKISEQRHLLASGDNPNGYSFYTENGGSVAYETTVPFYNWIRGSRLYLRGISIGCCTATETLIGTLADNILTGENKEVIEEVITEEFSTAEQLAEKYPFLDPVSEYNQPGEDTRDGALTVFFRQGKSNIERGFKDNNRSLVELISSIRMINESRDSKVAYIVIAGFASPEGSASFNEQLAGDRAMALKYFIMNNASMPESPIKIYNGAVDWDGLRKLVSESNMYDKHQILDIIDNTPPWDSQRQQGRLGRLQSLNGGVPYKYMLEHLFPLLRNAAYIKVYYDDM